jgi:sugar lactone lactonase YvrE
MRRLVVALAACTLVSCSEPITPQVGEKIAEFPALHSVAGLATPTSPVYILGGPRSSSEIIGYGVPGFKKPVVISTAGLADPTQLAIDSRGVIYVADAGGVNHKGSNVTEYKVGHKGSLRTVKAGIANPVAIAVSASGDLYVANGYGGKHGDVTVYPRDSVEPALTITNGIKSPSAITADGAAFVYVGNQTVISPGGNVREYPPETKRPAVTVTDEVNEPLFVATDKSENLYVASAQGQLTEYEPHSGTLTRTVQADDGWNITSLALDTSGNVYVGAWEESRNNVTYGEIVVYGSSGEKPLKTIKFHPGDVPTALAVDGAGDIYVLVGPTVGMCASWYKCPLWEYPFGWKNRSLIARSDEAQLLWGPLAVGSK